MRRETQWAGEMRRKVEKRIVVRRETQWVGEMRSKGRKELLWGERHSESGKWEAKEEKNCYEETDTVSRGNEKQRKKGIVMRRETQWAGKWKGKEERYRGERRREREEDRVREKLGGEKKEELHRNTEGGNSIG